jgi:hypothetical protein
MSGRGDEWVYGLKVGQGRQSAGEQTAGGRGAFGERAWAA